MGSESSTSRAKGLKTKGSKASAVLNTLNQSTTNFESSLVTSTLAHEIRNPLQTMKIHLDIAEKKGLSPDSISALKDQMSRLEGVVSKIQKLSDRITAHVKRDNIHEAIESTLASMRFWLSASGIEVKTHCDWEGNALCVFDRDLIEQVLLNLYMNSIQAMPAGGVLCVYVREELDHAAIEVSDSGPGINADLLAKIGTPFFTTKPQGNGLGVAFCKTVATLHGGSLEIQSAPGQGTTVTLRILKDHQTSEEFHNVH